MSTRLSRGARPATAFIPLCVPEIRGNEWRYVKECLDTGWVSSVGPFVDRFEPRSPTALGAAHAVATVNGTAALHVALLVAGVRPDDEVLVSTLTFIAPVNAVRYVGAWPVFIDAEPDYWQMDPRGSASSCANAASGATARCATARTGRRVSAILPVHVLGHPGRHRPDSRARRRVRPRGRSRTRPRASARRYRGRPVGQLGDIAAASASTATRSSRPAAAA